MNAIARTSPRETGVDRRIVLSGLWTSVLFIFAYVDIFTFWRADAIDGALSGSVPGTGLGIDQTFLVLTTAYILIPSLMVAASLLVPARVNQVLNLTVSVFYAGSIVATMIGESWLYYIAGSVVELALLATISGVAWSWRSRRTSGARPEALKQADR
ncbi:DUF6326 family protein [Arthrobacter sp. H35-D1]|uniref:DUF6326 family protein n=1 Tax=Arthrobacter sp. H35-D1 TaxID=3046202 RepID=UPI0024BAC161|nr:DUF6326 family protein [Arthrobacter sp. H35-D1]MDJ0314082.1 DUF6326 family protein [Arthrobacter sp. H35-D1]